MREDALLKIKLINKKGSAEGLRKELEAGIETRSEKIATSIDLPLSDDAKRVLVRAADEAERLNHRAIDSGHLVLGVFAMKGKAAEALAHQGVDRETYRAALAKSPEYSGEPVEAVEESEARETLEPAATREVVAASLRDAVSKLDHLLEQAAEQLKSVPESMWQRPLKRKNWTRKEALGHLIDWAAVHQNWFARALSEPRLAAGGYPEDTWVPAQRYGEVPWMELLHVWTSLNRLLIHVLAGIPEEKLTMSCRIGIEAPRTLKELIASYVDHCEDMVGQILAHG